MLIGEVMTPVVNALSSLSCLHEDITSIALLRNVDCVEHISFVMKVFAQFTCAKSSEVLTSDGEVSMVVVIVLIFGEKLNDNPALSELIVARLSNLNLQEDLDILRVEIRKLVINVSHLFFFVKTALVHH